MRIPLPAISFQISKLSSGIGDALKVNARLFTYCRTKYSHRQEHVLQKCCRCSFKRSYSSQSIVFENQPPSWLFVSKAVAGAYGAQVNLELDLDERLAGASLEKLKSDLKLRGMQFDIDDLVSDFRDLKTLEKKREDMENEKQRILADIKLLKQEKASEDVESALNKLYGKFSELKKGLSNSEPFWELETKVMLSALKLPNDLHSSTPIDDDVVLREVARKIDSSRTQSHVEIAKKFDLIKFSNVGPKAYYLKSMLALAEMSLVNTACNYLESKRYRHLSGPEFFKTPILEGCGRDVHNPDEVLTMISKLKDEIEPLNHLTGVSLPTFVGFVAKTNIGDNILPFNAFSCGRCYHNGDLPGLFGAVQTTQAAMFSCVRNENVDIQFHESVDMIWNFLEPFGFPLRLIQICARNLRREETRRFEVQMFAPSLQHFITVAHVSDLSDFVSRRLMVFHNQNHADIRSASLAHMISGSLVNVTSLLALWMEYSNTNQKSFSLSPLQCLQKP